MTVNHKKLVLYMKRNLGENSVFMEMLEHLCENPDDALERDCPKRMLNELNHILQYVERNSND